MDRRTTGLIPYAALLAVSTALLAGGTGWADTPVPDGSDHVEAMAREHASDEPLPSPATDASGDESGGIESSSVVYADLDGGPVRGYLARPTGVPSPPGVIVIHEWWGLNDNIRAMADRLAGAGFAALAVDLYSGHVATDRDDARALMGRALEKPDLALRNLAAAHAYLENEVSAPRVGSIGWCFGGGWSLEAALGLPGLDAAVMFYGRVVTDRNRLAALRTPLLGLFGAEDTGIRVDDVREFQFLLDDLEKDAAIFVYEGAGHAFANPSGTRYLAAAAEDAWAKTLDFLDTHLRPGA